MVFFDVTGEIEREWQHVSFWLWKIISLSLDKPKPPPILLLGTKAAETWMVDEQELQTRLEKLQARLPRLKQQLLQRPSGFVDNKCTWLFPVENKGDDYEEWINPLRKHLQRIALQFVTPVELWGVGIKLPAFAGVQSEAFPMTWLQAHDLLTQLGSGFRRETKGVVV